MRTAALKIASRQVADYPLLRWCDRIPHAIYLGIRCTNLDLCEGHWKTEDADDAKLFDRRVLTQIGFGLVHAKSIFFSDFEYWCFLA